MNKQEFIRKCEQHDFDYHKTNDPHHYDVEKNIEYELRRSIQEDPTLSYYYYKFGGVYVPRG